MIPRQFVPCSNTCIRNLNLGVSPTFVIEESTDVVPFLSSEQDEVAMCVTFCRFHLHVHVEEGVGISGKGKSVPTMRKEEEGE